MRKNILLIDDNKLLLDTVQEVLQLEGNDVTRCYCGSQVLELLSGKSFHAAIVDYHLPDATGAKITRILRKESPHTMIIGFSLLHRREEFMAAGADFFYPKPLINEVMQKINELDDRDLR